MLTFKEALCLLAIAIAYGITGRMDYEDALLLDQALQQDEDDCVPPLHAQSLPPEVGPTDPTKGAHTAEGAPSDKPCASPASPAQL